jgi:GTPase SAR1 family protein|tara:strand:+ start:27 stop:563 length:537 start_codon:yes stop_codon:yes gene_type:complete
MMQKIILIVGLPGSGKSTLLKHYKSHPFINYKIYDDWMECRLDDRLEILDFQSECRYDELIQNLKEDNICVVSCTSFCDNEFLCKSEYYLKLNIPNIKITKIYFENNIFKCESNIMFRDKKRGGYWKVNKNDGVSYYHGKIFNENPVYLKEIDELKQLSKSYIIPKNQKPLIINVQKD